MTYAGPWVQPPDQTFVYAHPQGVEHQPTTGAAADYMGCVAGTSNALIKLGTVDSGRNGYGPPPIDSAPFYNPNNDAALSCAWRGLRRGVNDTSIAWGGTCDTSPWGSVDPLYAPPVYSLDDDPGFHWVGVNYQAADQGHVNEPPQVAISWGQNNTVVGLNPQDILDRAGPSGVGIADSSLPALDPGDVIEWESEGSTLTGLQSSWDDIGLPMRELFALFPHTQQTSRPLEYVKWYREAGPTSQSWDFIGDAFSAPSAWVDIPETLWAPGPGVGIRFLAVAPQWLSDDTPAMGQALAGVNNANVTIYKKVYMAFKVTLRPSRYRIIHAGDEPPAALTTLAPPLRLHPRTDGLGLSSAVRVWPPARSQQRSGRPSPGSYL